MKMKLSNWLMLAMGIVECILGFPVLGGALIITFLWIPMILALVGHIAVLVFTLNAKRKIAPSVMGIVANTVGLIPIVGMILHILAAIFNMVGAFRKE